MKFFKTRYAIFERNGYFYVYRRLWWWPWYGEFDGLSGHRTEDICRSNWQAYRRECEVERIGPCFVSDLEAP